MRGISLSRVTRLVLAGCVLAGLFAAVPAAAVPSSAGIWPGVTWALTNPQGIALDALGNAYVADTGADRVVKFDAAGRYVTSWGGTGTDNGKFDSPWDVACDPSGTNVFVTDTKNHRVQQFTVVGATATFVRKWGKEGGPDFSGSNPGEFNEPRGIVMDPVGDLYVVDTKNYRVQKFRVNAAGVSFVLSWGHAGSDVDKFLEPWAIDISPTNGWVYVLDRDETNCYVRVFDTDGDTVSFPAGGNGWGAPTITWSPGYFAQPEGIAIDDDGNVYVSDNKPTSSWVQKFTYDGEWLTGWGRIRQYGDVNIDGDPVFYSPGGMEASGSGTDARVLVADGYNDRFREFDATGEPLTLHDSHGVLGSHGDAWWRFDQPYDVEEASGTVYVADRMNHRVSRFSATGDFDTITPTEIYTLPRVDNGYFNQPSAVAYDPITQFVYVAEVGNDRIQRLTADLEYEGNKWGAYGTAEGAFKDPQGVAVGPSPTDDRWVYVSDTGNNRIQVFDPRGVYQTQFGAGTITAPAGIVVDSDGTVYVVDSSNKRVYRFTPTNSNWTTWTSTVIVPGTGTGDAALVKPWGLALADSGSLYVTDVESGKVKRYNKNTGAYELAFASVGYGAGNLNLPRGVDVSPQGVIYVADTENDRFQAFVEPITIDIFGVADRGSYNTAVQPSVIFGPGAITAGTALDGWPWDNSPIIAPGVHVLRAWATDSHGLLHEKTVEFTIDYDPPVTYRASETTTFTNQALINLTPTDALSGVASTRYRVDLGAEKTGVSVLVGQQGPHTLSYWSIDRAGNTEAAKEFSFFVNDTLPPVTTTDNKSTYTDAATIVLTPTDPTGPCTTWYRLNGGPIASGTRVSVSGPGVYTLEFGSTDAAGNKEPTKTTYFTVNQSTAVTVGRSASKVAYGGSVAITAKLRTGSGVAVTGQTMKLHRSYDGTAWTVLNTQTSATGNYSYSVKVYRKTYFKWEYAGKDRLMPSSGNTSVISKARVYEPVAPRSAYRYRTVALYGYLKPKHTSGTKCIELRAYRYESGKWVRRATSAAIVGNYDTYSRYRGALVFKYRGKWRVRAAHIDGDHVASYSTYDYLTIK